VEFSSDVEMRKIPDLTRDFFKYALFDEEPVFISDEATIWDVSTVDSEELTKRCLGHYGTSVSTDDFKQPLWKLISQLDERRSHPPNEERS
jgi:hypothetical protein